MLEKINEIPPANDFDETKEGTTKVSDVKDLETVAIDRYFTLRKPIVCNDQEISKILCDPSELTGKQYFKLVSRFRNEYSDVYRNTLNKLQDDLFISYVIAELNPPMTLEDVQQIPFSELSIIVVIVASFVYGVTFRVQGIATP